MTAIFIDSATVYQIFYMRYRGLSATAISKELGLSRNCVRWHLQFRYLSRYPDATLRRIKLLNPERRPSIEPAHPWIRLADASYFFPSRPSAKTLMVSSFFGRMRSRTVSGMRVTKRDWINRFIDKHIEDVPTGLCFASSACERLDVAKGASARWTGQKLTGGFVRYAELQNIPLDRKTVAKALQIQEWTRLPFVSLDAMDILCPFA